MAVLGTALILVLGASAVTIYIVPTWIAWGRHHPGTLWLLVLNLLFGWTVIGWLAALIWALVGSPSPAGKGWNASICDVANGLILTVVCPLVFVGLIALALAIMTF